MKFHNLCSGIQLLGCSKFSINWKNNNDVIICRHEVIVKFFDAVLFLLKSSVTGPSFMSISSLVLEFWQMTIFFYKGLTRNPKNWNNPRLSFPQYLEMGQVRDTKFDTNLSNEMLLNTFFDGLSDGFK